MQVNFLFVRTTSSGKQQLASNSGNMNAHAYRENSTPVRLWLDDGKGKCDEGLNHSPLRAEKVLQGKIS